jgi:hypothetical protein
MNIAINNYINMFVDPILYPELYYCMLLLRIIMTKDIFSGYAAVTNGWFVNVCVVARDITC